MYDVKHLILVPVRNEAISLIIIIEWTLWVDIFKLLETEKKTSISRKVFIKLMKDLIYHIDSIISVSELQQEQQHIRWTDAMINL